MCEHDNDPQRREDVRMIEGTHPAVSMVSDRAANHREAARFRLATALDTDNVELTDVQLTEGVARNSRLTLNFHPDRRTKHGRTVAEGLLENGFYLPQSHTGVSNGQRYPIGAGDRTRWETSMFGNTYDEELLSRPLYGALDLTWDPHGGSPRFGSSYLVLEQHCMARATFCVGDSHNNPADRGTIDNFTSILAGLFEQTARPNGALDRAIGADQLQQMLRGEVRAAEPARQLDGYVEAQFHGELSLHRDVRAIVLDPSYRSTEIETVMTRAASEFDAELRWHGGSELRAEATPEDFRGPDMPALASEVADADGLVDAAAIGRRLIAEPGLCPSTETGPLQSPHFGEPAWRRQQVFFGPLLDDTTVLDDENPINVIERCQTMSDHNRGSPFPELEQ